MQGEHLCLRCKHFRRYPRKALDSCITMRYI